MNKIFYTILAILYMILTNYYSIYVYIIVVCVGIREYMLENLLKSDDENMEFPQDKCWVCGFEILNKSYSNLSCEHNVHREMCGCRN